MRAAWTLTLSLLIACSRRDAPAPREAPPSPAVEASSAGVSTSDLEAAARWLEALRDRNQQRLTDATRFPFELHDHGGRCGTQTAAEPQALSSATTCLVNDRALIKLMNKDESAAVEPLTETWEEAWSPSAAPPHLVTASFAADDARAELALSIVDGGVRGVWKRGTARSPLVQLAEAWVEALRGRDLAGLARVTVYPFELRDTGRDATCRQQRANDREALARAVDCLFRSERLQRALIDTPSSGFDPLQPGAEPPSWSQGWRKAEHEALRSVTTMVATRDGYEYDLELLMAPEGVRAVWKLGSWEARD